MTHFDFPEVHILPAVGIFFVFYVIGLSVNAGPVYALLYGASGIIVAALTAMLLAEE